MIEPTPAFPRALPLAVSIAVDLAFGEPPTSIHPVVAIGRVVSTLERRAPRRPRPRLVYGALSCAGVVGLSAAGGCLVERFADRLPGVPRVVLLGVCLKSTFAMRGLVRSAEHVRACLEEQDLSAARSALRSLVSRDVATLGSGLIAAAAVESVAENTSDSVTGPLLSYMLAGLPGAMAYRAINTLDSMWGYHGSYEHLGKAAARLDDLVNIAPSRLTALLLVISAPLVGLDGSQARQVMRRDHRLTESPNAGWPMSAAAGALHVQLEKVGHYVLGAPAAQPTAGTIRQSVRLASAAIGVLVALAVGLDAARGALRPGARARLITAADNVEGCRQCTG